MPKETSKKNIETKYCLFQRQEVYVHFTNENGRCRCMNCQKKKCDPECEMNTDEDEDYEDPRWCYDCIAYTRRRSR